MITDPRRLIIRRPGAKSAEGKLIAWLLSLGFWWRLARMIRLFLLAVGWGAAWGVSSAIVGHTPAGTVLQAAMFIYLPITMGFALLLWGWAFYNWSRFHGKRDKRHEPLLPLSLEEIGAAFSLPQSILRQAKSAKVDICYFDDKGNIEGIACFSSVSEAEKFLHPLPVPGER